MIGLIITISLLALFMLLSFISPEKTENKFWKTVNKVRRGMDFICYWMMNAFGILALVLAVLLGLHVIG
ncbi:MAG: hypothetical protein IJV15_10770 [Lachnospiraceae bacterium]|nr:hypothetical protein [Lachnospiraceae bacterium]